MISTFDWTPWWEGTQSAAGTGTVILIGFLLVVAAITSWSTNVFSLPGNWGVVFFAAVGLVVPRSFEADYNGPMLMDWPTVAVLFVLAGVGEFLETVTGAAGAAKRGAARRSMVLSVIGAMVGSIVGATAGIPVPLVGPLIAAVLGGALGAFGGAYLGEAWRGSAHDDRVSISSAAFTGKIAGTAAKILIGAVMCGVLTVSLFV